jgi:hypothetical protein
LASTLPDMVTLIRKTLPGGPTLLKPEIIEPINQSPGGLSAVCCFRRTSRQGHALARALILGPSAFEHQDARRELFLGRTYLPVRQYKTKGYAGITPRGLCETLPLALQRFRLGTHGLRLGGLSRV